MSKIQNENVKTLAEIIADGGSASNLIQDSKIYVTANNTNKQLSQAITDGDIGGASGSTGINYIGNFGFEYNINGWVISKNTTAGAAPDNGFVSSGVLNALSHVVSPSMRGKGHSSLTLNQIGDQLYSEFTITQSDVNKLLGVSFEYSTLADYADKGVTVWIYDIANNLFTNLGPIEKNLTSSAKFNAFFQTTSSLTYRILLHQSLAMAGVTIKLDSFQVGPDNFIPSTGPVVLSLDSGSNPGVSGAEELVVNFVVAHDTQGLYNSSDKKIYIKENGYYSLNGIVYFNAAASAGNCINVLVFKLNGVQQPDIARVDRLAAENQQVTAIAQGSTNDFYAKAGDYIDFYTFQNSGVTRAASLVRVSLTKVPSQPTSVGNGKVTLVNIHGVEGQSIAHTANESIVPPVVQFSQATIDTDSLVTLNTGIITFKEGGYYKINGKFGHNRIVNISYAFLVQIRLNGLIHDNRFAREDVISSANLSELSSSGTIIMQVKAGDYITFNMFQNSGSTALSASNRITVEKVTPPVTLGISSTVAAQYRCGSGQVIPNGIFTVVNFETKSYDYKNNVTTGSNWKFTSQEKSLYNISGFLEFAGASWSPGEEIAIDVYINGIEHSRVGGATTQSSHGSHTYIPISAADVRLLVGDYIQIIAYQTSGSSLNLLVQSIWNWVSIKKIGEY